ncbi:MAG: oligoendopeptidase F [Vicinamibacterales bacterium]
MYSPTTPASRSTTTPSRQQIAERYKWQLSDIFPDWQAWQAGYDELDRRIGEYSDMRGTLATGPDALVRAFRLGDSLGQLAFRVYYFASLFYDQDQRDNEINARRQAVQILLARWKEAASWFNPELLHVPFDTLRAWMDASPELAVYRFAIEDLFRQQAHVLDEAGEALLSLAGRFANAPNDAYSALTTADAKFPTITLSTGETVTVSYSQYRAILATSRVQADREAAYRALYGTYATNLNTYAALYTAVCERDWFQARARRYNSTLEAALDGDNIPGAVVENLISSARANVEPFRRYHRLRKKTLGLDRYHLYDQTIPLVNLDRRYAYDETLSWIVESVAPLGPAYQERTRRAFEARWIDVYENEGKRSGAYSAPVHGVHPYMLLNFNDTLDAVFTLAHEMGHSMHTLLAHEHQPFIYSDYSIFVAEVPSTLSEALLLDHMLTRTGDPLERAVLLQHGIDNIVGTFYTQVVFADFELQAHRLVERNQPITAEVLNRIYRQLLSDYYGDSLDEEPLASITWARIPHFYNSPYYVYQYATCFAAAAKLTEQLLAGPAAERAAARERYITLLSSGSSNHPMKLLQAAGIDLSRPETVEAVSASLDKLVDRLEDEIRAVGGAPAHRPGGEQAETGGGRLGTGTD